MIETPTNIKISANSYFTSSGSKACTFEDCSGTCIRVTCNAIVAWQNVNLRNLNDNGNIHQGTQIKFCVKSLKLIADIRLVFMDIQCFYVNCQWPQQGDPTKTKPWRIIEGIQIKPYFTLHSYRYKIQDLQDKMCIIIKVNVFYHNVIRVGPVSVVFWGSHFRFLFLVLVAYDGVYIKWGAKHAY